MLLDTCALLWLAHDQTKISTGVIKQIDGSPVVFVSSVTGFEICLKNRSGKLDLPVPQREWLRLILEHHRINVIDLDLEICIRATELPLIHRDLCDRFIIATALTKGLPVVTGDSIFSEYGVDILI